MLRMPVRTALEWIGTLEGLAFLGGGGGSIIAMYTAHAVLASDQLFHLDSNTQVTECILTGS